MAKSTCSVARRLSIASLASILVAALFITGCRSDRDRAPGAKDSATPEATQPTFVRASWDTSRVHGSPEAPSPYQTARMFPKLTFDHPLHLELEPVSNRWYVTQQDGRVLSFPNDEKADHADIVFDPSLLWGLENIADCKGIGGSLGIVLHPKFVDNHYIYIQYNLDFWTYQRNHENGSRVSRFTIRDTSPPTVDYTSEKVISQWLSGGHNGCTMKFGPDGYMYISTGDAGDPDPPDPFNTGQDISDLLSSVLRIDVDHPSADLAYSIPPDNPFVKTPGARGEVWAYGLRNPFRMSFDRHTGNLWVGDVGWELWESVDCVKAGGNYGWSIMEGPNPVHPQGKRGPTPISKPQVELSHSESASLTGGVVYHGKKLPDLAGYYIFGDWQTSRLWAAKCNGDTLEPHREIAQTDQRIVSFAEDADGEIVIVDHGGGGLWRIEPNPKANEVSHFPHKLSETGLFSAVDQQKPQAGVVAFTINAHQWVDGATGRHWVAVPQKQSMTWGKGVWGDDKPLWPTDTVLVRTLSLPTNAGKPGTKNVETQLLQFDGRQWQAYTYAWNDAGTDAELIGAAGEDRTVALPDLTAPDGVRNRRWHYQSRSQCMTCHNVWCDYLLAFNEPQLDCTASLASADGTSISDNEIHAFRSTGLIITPKPPLPPRPLRKGEVPPPPPPPPEKTALTDPYDASADLNERARSYLHVNCSVCHRFGGGGSALIDLSKPMNPPKMHAIDERPLLGDYGIADARIICPGDPNRSVLLYRTSKLGRGRMPHIGSDIVDERGTKLLRDWMAAMPPGAPTTAPSTGPSIDNVAALHDASATTQAVSAAAEQLLSSTSGAMKLVGLLQEGTAPQATRDAIVSAGLNAKLETAHDLFRQFDRNEQSGDKLGSTIDPKRVLAVAGDASRGKAIFFTTSGGLCARCHRTGGQGTDLGPDLSHISTKYPNKTDMLDNIINPSKTIADGFTSYIVRTKSGDVYSGLIRSRTPEEIVIKDASMQEKHIPTDQIEKSAAQKISIMPEGLLSDLTPQQAADLLEYLGSLK